MVPQSEYEKLEALEDALLAARVNRIVANEKSLGPEESTRLIQKLLARADD